MHFLGRLTPGRPVKSGFYGLTVERFHVVDFVLPLRESGFYFFIRRQSPKVLQFEIFVAPFHIFLWIAILATGTVSTFFLWGIDKGLKSEEKMSLIDAFWISLGKKIVLWSSRGLEIVI